MAEWAKQALAGPIHLADEVVKACTHSDRSECQQELKPRADRIAALLRQAARSPDLYERPARRILQDVTHTLDKALQLVLKSSHQSFLFRLFSMTPAASFKKLSVLLDNSLGDLSWLLRVSHPDPEELALGLPPIAANEPILGFIWEHVARLQYAASPPEQRAEAASALASFADNDRHRHLIIDEGAVPPLLRLLKESGRPEAVKAIALLANDPDSVEEMVKYGACSVLTSVLKDGTMRVQAAVAATVADFATYFPKSQDIFHQHNAPRLLVGHLAFETIEEHSKYTLPSRTSMHSVVQSTMNASKPPPSSSSTSTTTATPSFNLHAHPVSHHYSSSATTKVGREAEDPATKSHLKAMAAKALGCLCRNNAAVCKSVTESRAMLCFSVLLEKGAQEVQIYSTLALMEIAKVAEKDADLRHSAFKPTATAARAVVDQLLKVVEKGDYTELLIPCIISLGCLSKTFRASETRIIPPLVRLLDQREQEVMKETALALTKFAYTGNFLHAVHSKSIIEAGGAKHLIQLVYFEELEIKVPALTLLCYIAKAVPDSEELAEGNVRSVLEWASKQSSLVQDSTLDTLLPETRTSLELYQSGASNSMGGGNGGGFAL